MSVFGDNIDSAVEMQLTLFMKFYVSLGGETLHSESTNHIPEGRKRDHISLGDFPLIKHSLSILFVLVSPFLRPCDDSRRCPSVSTLIPS